MNIEFWEFGKQEMKSKARDMIRDTRLFRIPNLMRNTFQTFLSFVLSSLSFFSFLLDLLFSFILIRPSLCRPSRKEDFLVIYVNF